MPQYLELLKDTYANLPQEHRAAFIDHLNTYIEFSAMFDKENNFDPFDIDGPDYRVQAAKDFLASLGSGIVELYPLKVNLNTGFLIDAENRIFAAYNKRKNFVIFKEGFRAKDFTLPEEFKFYNSDGIAGHFKIGYWCMVESKEKDF